MKKLPLSLVIAAVGALACGEETLTAVVEDGATGSALNGTAPSPSGECDATKIKDNIVASYGASATLTDHHARRYADLGVVYDGDDSGTLDETEQAAILADFTAGCTAIKARVVAQWDTDGDGVLSETELAAAQAAHDAEHPPCPEGERHGRGHHRGPPPDADGGTPPARPPHDHVDGDRPERPAHDHADRPSPMMAEFDTNADGTLDATEKAAMRTLVKARIAAGERPFQPPAPATP
jgi:hypothetical protein